MPPLIPAPVAVPPDASMPDNSQPDTSSFQAKRPQVFNQPTAQDQIGGHLQGRLQADYQKDADPYGSPDNHPGVFGKILHGLNVATGGVNRRGFEEQGLEKRLNDLASENSKNAYQGAETGKTLEETKEMPGKAQSEEDLQGAETQQRLHPAEKWEPVAGWQGPQNEPMEFNASTGVYRPAPGGSGASLTKEPPVKGMEKVNVVGPDGKPIVGNYHTDTGKITDASGKEIPNARPYEKPDKAPEGPHQLMMIPDGQGGFTATNVLPGTHVAGNAMTATGVNTLNTPTSTMRTGAGRAAMVNEAIPGVLADIEKNKEQMGPLMGRWNDFMQGKVGSENPDFAALRMDLTLMGTAVALAHAQGRLPENLREEFDKAINAPQQTPENLEAAIKAVQPWMARMQQAGQVPQPAPKETRQYEGHPYEKGDDGQWHLKKQ